MTIIRAISLVTATAITLATASSHASPTNCRIYGETWQPGLIIPVYVDTDPVDGLAASTHLSEMDVELAVKRTINIINEEMGAKVKLRFAGPTTSKVRIGQYYVVHGIPMTEKCLVGAGADSFNSGTGHPYLQDGETGVYEGTLVGAICEGTIEPNGQCDGTWEGGTCEQIDWQVSYDEPSVAPDLVSVLLHEFGHVVFDFDHPDDPVGDTVGCVVYSPPQLSMMYSTYPHGYRMRVLKEYDVERAQSFYGPRSQLASIYKNHYTGSWVTSTAIPGQTGSYPLFRMGSVSQGLNTAVLGWVSMSSSLPQLGGLGTPTSAIYNGGLSSVHSFTTPILTGGTPETGLSRPIAIATKPSTGETYFFEEDNDQGLYTINSDVAYICYRRSTDSGVTFTGGATCLSAATGRYGLTATYDPYSDMFLVAYIANDSDLDSDPTASTMHISVATIPASGNSTIGHITSTTLNSWHAPGIACSGASTGCRLVYEDGTNAGCLSWATAGVGYSSPGVFSTISSYSQCYELFDTPSVVYNPSEGAFRLAFENDGDAIYSYSMSATGTSWTGTGDIWNNPSASVSNGVLGTLLTGGGTIQTQGWFMYNPF